MTVTDLRSEKTSGPEATSGPGKAFEPETVSTPEKASLPVTDGGWKWNPEQTAAVVDERLAEGYRYWEDFGLPPLTPKERYGIAAWAAASCEKGTFAVEYAAACQCFYLFRRLHGMVETEPERATLLGDYFFSQFSHYLIPIDSTRLIDIFSEYLKTDARDCAGGREDLSVEAYMDFIRNTAKEIGL